ncbi:Wzz/FepE/Etk N-terminal domain-containing protein [SAR86 cluster bacterium]|nr:Wzz/FepE/Etk N-terminal domain-containing protein [SAR86 cluster bacterium]
MEEETKKIIQSYEEDSVNFLELFLILWKEKIKIIFVTFLFAIFSVFYALSLPNIYKSEAILTLSNNSGSDFSKLVQNYSSLASLAGISLQNLGPEGDKLNEAVERMQSLDFFEEFILKNDLYVKLLAVRSWDQDEDKLIINKSLYDVDKDEWLDDSKFSVNGKPSIQTAHRNFLEKLNISINNKTGFLEIDFVHPSPKVAREILDLIIYEINEKTRSEEKLLAEKTIVFLEEELKNAQLQEIRSGISSLIQNQVEKMTFASASPEYLFKILSKPTSPELKSEPRRSVICIVITFLGGLLISFYVLAVHYLRNTEKNNS